MSGRTVFLRQDLPPCHAAALDYLRRELSPLALCPPDHAGIGEWHTAECSNPGKRPWHKWQHLQTQRPTEEMVNEWFRKVPGSNVGLALCDIIRIDVDGEGGEKLFMDLCGELPVTVEFTTPSGGRGLLFRVPKGAKVKTTPKKAECINGHQELRFQARGAQTVVPPSRCAAGEWRWVPGRGMDDVEIAELPPPSC